MRNNEHKYSDQPTIQAPQNNTTYPSQQGTEAVLVRPEPSRNASKKVWLAVKLPCILFFATWAVNIFAHILFTSTSGDPSVEPFVGLKIVTAFTAVFSFVTIMWATVAGVLVLAKKSRPTI